MKLHIKPSGKHKFEYDLNFILSRLLYSKIMFPASKLATYALSKKYIEQPNFDTYIQNIRNENR